MQEVILLKFGEMALKGLNHTQFENLLVQNVRQALKHLGAFEITVRQSVAMVRPKDEQTDMGKALEICRRVFGVATCTKAGCCEKDFSLLCSFAKDYLAESLENAASFKVEAKRSDKRYPLNSPQICEEMGAFLLSSFPHLKVDVHTPDVTVWVEIREEFAFVHNDALEGAGGLPVGSSGKAVSLLSGGFDSPVSSFLMAKRGVSLSCVHFASPPYTGDLALLKVKKLTQKLSLWTGPLKLTVVPLTKAQEQIRDECKEEFSTLILRRLMLRLAEKTALAEKASALITGESMGQVASQTMQAIACTDAAVSLPVFRPLIGADKREIIALARKIDTYDLSALPYEDCCTVFTPKHPRTKPVLRFLEQAEKSISDWDSLIEEAFENRTEEWITLSTVF